MSNVKNVMSKKPTTINEDSDVRHICRVLHKNKLSGIPVVDKTKKLVGFVSERDVIAAVAKPKFLDLTAKSIMKKNVKTVSPDDHLVQASKLFTELHLRILPVVKDKKVVGIITRNDVIKKLLGGLH